MKTSQQDVVTAETQVLQQEMILKSVLTRSGFNNPAVVGARIVPTDHFDVPAQDAIQPTQDMVAEAFQKRPEIEQSQIGLEDARISMLGTKNNLLPSLSVFANLSNNGLAGRRQHPARASNGTGSVSQLHGGRSANVPDTGYRTRAPPT